jgi:hypothetical protein
MSDPVRLSPEEIALIADQVVFRAKATIMAKVRVLLEAVHAAFQEELAHAALLEPPGFDPSRYQFVKGEHLDDHPYQYLDFPKHFDDGQIFTFRTLVWWGHHVVFALMLAGEDLIHYKRNLINRYGQIAGRDLALCLAPTLWEWKQGPGYTLPLTCDHKSHVAAVLEGRPFMKLARFVPISDPIIREGRLVDAAREAFRALLLVITRDPAGTSSSPVVLL